ncbi:MAG: EAL domain-containing protein [Pseudomonadota bacterium]|nr:EAL domain-containing protein [Pseudomonadota bacterium]
MFPVSNNILLIQDDPSEATGVREALLSSSDGLFQVDWLRSCAEAEDRLRGNAGSAGQMSVEIAAILVDLALPDCSGIETFDRVLQAAPQIPILVLCDSQCEEIGKLAVQRGAQDYLLKARLDSYLLPKAVSSMIERAANAEALFEEKERAQVTLNSIGDAVMSTDVWGKVTYLNAVAEMLTGWTCEEANAHPLEEVFHIIDADTREVAPNPMLLAIAQNQTVGLTPNCLLVRRDGVESSIEDSAAPIHDRRGAVTGAVMVFHDVTTARALSLRMAYLAQHDGLTDLPNRALLEDRVVQAIALAGRRNRKLALLFLDMDRFKSTNDSLGHSAGALLLKSVAQRLVACVRRSDTVSRQGGDEFVILLPDIAHSEDASICADKMLKAIATPHAIDQHELRVTGSIGIATYPDDGRDAETLLRNADFAMYHAKEIGRNNVQFFKAEMNARAVERHAVEEGLHLALKRQEFELNYQSKIDLDSGDLIGVEALIRWHHPERGLVLPGQFIPVAEECGLIVKIGRWVLREACRQARAWQDAGQPELRMAVNVSAVELRAKNFIADVRAILTETGMNPRWLELELTETSLIEDASATSAVLQELKDMGLRIALDDFGTGYSSLSFLQRYPIDEVKIDRSFIRNVTTNGDDASIVSAVIAMGRSLHVSVVAEGIETREQLCYLRNQACPLGQGYHFGRPVVAAEFVRAQQTLTARRRMNGNGESRRPRPAAALLRPTGLSP